MFSNNLFGNNTSNNNQNQVNRNIFGTNQSNSPFGNNNQQNQGFFGNNNNNNNSFGVNNNNNNNNITFPGNNNNINFSFSVNNNNNLNNQNNMINNNNINNFVVNNNNNQINQINMTNNNNINNNQNTNFFTTVIPVIALSKDNGLRNIQFGKFPQELQKDFMTLKLNLREQNNKIDQLQIYSKRIIELIEQNNKSISKLEKANISINQKLNIFEEKINQIKENFNFISESFEEEDKNIKLLEQNSKYKIEIPSQFLVNYSQNLFKRTELFKKKLDDIITLIKISYAQKTNNYEFDCDIMESTLAEFIKIVRNLLEANSRQEKMINDMIQILLKFSSDFGENPETIYNNVMKYAIEGNLNSN